MLPPMGGSMDQTMTTLTSMNPPSESMSAGGSVDEHGELRPPPEAIVGVETVDEQGDEGDHAVGGGDNRGNVLAIGGVDGAERQARDAGGDGHGHEHLALVLALIVGVPRDAEPGGDATGCAMAVEPMLDAVGGFLFERGHRERHGTRGRGQIEGNPSTAC
jgi:hypothetical protein